jgi:hypothetical protein
MTTNSKPRPSPAPISQDRQRVPSEKSGDINLARPAHQVRVANLITIDRRPAILREDDGDLGTYSRTRWAISLALLGTLHLNDAVIARSEDIEKAEAQALVTTGAAAVIDYWKPGIPDPRRLAVAAFRVRIRWLAITFPRGTGQRRQLRDNVLHVQHAYIQDGHPLDRQRRAGRLKQTPNRPREARHDARPVRLGHPPHDRILARRQSAHVGHDLHVNVSCT